MFRSNVAFSFRRTASVALVAVLSCAAAAAPAEARRRHHGRHHAAASAPAYSPPYSAMVVDGNTGKTLYATNENALRHPASITKVMTLFLLFEQLEKGRYTLDSPLRVSANASRQEPSKLGLKPGETIDVENAIKAIVTRSANDVAVVIGENIGGSEENFASLMTRKAHAIGMARTVYRNSSGLPDPEQVTTAYDLILLGRAIQERFPTYYKYFSTSSFRYAGATIRNHNHLLGRVEGVDGIKTGYTRASGFNLLTSIRVGGRHLVASVLGGRSAAIRDRQMAALLEEHMDAATPGRRTVAAVTESEDEGESAPVVAAPAKADPSRVAAIPPAERAKPAVVTELPRTRPEPPANITPPLSPRVAAPPIRVPAPPVVAATTPSGPAMRWIIGPNAASQRREARLTTNSIGGNAPDDTADQPLPSPALSFAPTERPIAPILTPLVNAVAKPEGRRFEPTPPPKSVNVVIEPAKADPSKAEPVKPEALKAESVKPEVAKAEARPAKVEASAPPAAKRAGWIIQLAAMDDEAKAKDLLSSAASRGRAALASAEPFTEKVEKGGSVLYRARFAGFGDDEDAQAACKALKRAGFSCFAQHI